MGNLSGFCFSQKGLEGLSWKVILKLRPCPGWLKSRGKGQEAGISLKCWKEGRKEGKASGAGGTGKRVE